MFCGESLESNGGMTQLTWPTSNADILHMKLCNIPGYAATDIKAYQNISRLTSTIHHNMSCLIKGGNHWPFRIQQPRIIFASLLLQCQKTHHFIRTKAAFSRNQPWHFALSSFWHCNNPSRKHWKWREHSEILLPKKKHVFLHESWTTWVKHHGLQPNPWPKCRGWESSPTLKNTPMMRALRPHIGQGWWGAPHSG